MVSSFVALLVCIAAASVVHAERSYRGAVAEHNIYFDPFLSPSDNLAVNLNLYKELIIAAAENDAQILVFPEFGLTPGDMANRTLLSSLAESIPPAASSGVLVPCTDDSFDEESILKSMSCAAKASNMSVLINMIDSVLCVGKSADNDNCPDDGQYLYNTNVVFDEEGSIVAKYHKSHEWWPLLRSYDQAPADSATYHPSWGPEFGIFTCFDILHATPAVQLYVKQMHLSHFLYPVSANAFLSFFSHTPYISIHHSLT
jgi:pantetheine hydrolase